MSNELKTCAVDPSHIWMADIPYCPYCNFTIDERIAYLRREAENERVMRRRKQNGS